jgi:4-hydroxythreonine-4-phosphate dehydrogenase
VALTLGDPAGVGPELAARVCRDPEVVAAVRPVVVGRHMIFQAGALAAGLHTPEVELVEAGQGAEIKPGRPSGAGGRQAAAFIEAALELCTGGRAEAMVTGPISKAALAAAGYPDTGHTTLLARLTGARPAMMMAGPRLKVVLATVHCALAEVPARLTAEAVEEVGRLGIEALLRYFGPQRPRVAVAALNPHAGEGGMFGDEEERVIAPAVHRLRGLGAAVEGPLPPDTVYWQAAEGEYDLVVGMYHDQALVPFKLLHFHDGVNVTLGLPVIRTSPDHGTAYAIAGQGKARADSLKAAMLLAGRMALAKRRQS